MNRRSSRGLAAGTGVIAVLLIMSSVAWACQGFKGHGLWEGNGVPTGTSGDGTNGNLHYPPTSGATWDLTTDGVGAAATAHHHCNATNGDELPGAGLDGEAHNANWYGGGTAPTVFMPLGQTGAKIALKVEPSTICMDPNPGGTNKLPQLVTTVGGQTNGYELYTADNAGPGIDGSSLNPNACHVKGGNSGGNRVSASQAVKIDSSGYSVDGSGAQTTYVLNGFRAGGTAGTYRMICLWDDDGETSDALAINVAVI